MPKAGPKEEKAKRPKIEGKIDIPRITITEAIELLNKVKSEYGNVIAFKHLAKLKYGTENTRGGAFGQLVKSLKLYGLMTRFGKSELKITDIGNKIINTKDEETRTSLMLNQFLGVPILHELFNFYDREGLPRKKKIVAERIAIKYNIERRDAGRLASIFYREFEKFKHIRVTETAKGALGLAIGLAGLARPKITAEQQQIGAPQLTTNLKELAQLVETMHQLFPSKIGTPMENVKVALASLVKLTNKYGLGTFSAYLESFQSAYKNKSNAELKEELKRNARIAINLYEKDLKIGVSP